jgi:hypothetical protein
MRRLRSVLLLVICAAPLQSQLAARDTLMPARLAIIGVGGHRPGLAFEAAAMLDSSLQAANVQGLSLLRAQELEQYIRDFAYVDWTNAMPLNDLLALCRILRLDGLLELRLEPRSDSTIAHLRLLDAKLGEWISTRRTRRHVSFQGSVLALRPVADSLAQAFAHIR